MSNDNPELSKLKQSIMESLKASGTLSTIKAEIQSQLFASLYNQPNLVEKHDEYSTTIASVIDQDVRKILITELIREFLSIHGFVETLSIFDLEAKLKPHVLRDRVESYVESVVPDYSPSRVSSDSSASILEKMLSSLELNAYGCEIQELLTTDEQNEHTKK